MFVPVFGFLTQRRSWSPTCGNSLRRRTPANKISPKRFSESGNGYNFGYSEGFKNSSDGDKSFRMWWAL